jgi:hypothetical protein
MAALVVCACYRPEALLPSCIPYLQFALGVVDIQSFEPKVHADRGKIVIDKGVVAEAEEQRRFAHTLVPHYHQLEKIIVLLYHTIY